MAIWDKLKTELDRAGKAAQGALDEGKTRLEAFRARQLADKAAQALGYAVFRAKQAGTEVDWETLQRLVNALAEKEAEVQRLEKELREEEKTATEDSSRPRSRLTHSELVRGRSQNAKGRTGGYSQPVLPSALSVFCFALLSVRRRQRLVPLHQLILTRRAMHIHAANQHALRARQWLERIAAPDHHVRLTTWLQ